MITKIQTKNKKKKTKDGHTTFLYVGSLSSSVRSPECFLKIFCLAKDYPWEAIFVGEENSLILKEYASIDKRIKVIGRCTHEETLCYEENADIFINIGNNNPNLTPSKIFEYMSFGKPIVSTFPIDNESSKNYLRKYPNALLIDERSKIEESLKSLLSFLSKEHEIINYDTLSNIFKNNCPSEFVNIIIDD